MKNTINSVFPTLQSGPTSHSAANIIPTTVSGASRKERVSGSKMDFITILGVMLLSVGCDFTNPLAGEEIALENELIGVWKANAETVTISKGEKPDTYSVKHAKSQEEEGVSVEESLDFIGSLVKHKGRVT